MKKVQFVSGRFDGMTQRSLKFLHSAFFNKSDNIVTKDLKSYLGTMGLAEVDFIATIVGWYESQRWYKNTFEADCAIGISWLYQHVQVRQTRLENRSKSDIMVRPVDEDMAIWVMWQGVLDVEYEKHLNSIQQKKHQLSLFV